MNNSPDSLQLSPSEWERLRDLVDRFEEACKKYDDVELTGFLPPPEDSLRPAVLSELIRTDMEIRYGNGQPLPVEDYLRRFPELGGPTDVSVSLLLEEYRLRRRFDLPVSPEDYRSRFPQQAHELERLVREAGFLSDAVPTPSFPMSSGKTVETAQPSEILPMGQGYRLIRIIGKGTFGEVWEAMAPGDFPAAIKIILRTADSEEVQRERRALEMVRHLQHSNLLQVTAAWHLEDRLIVAMELATCNLRERLRECQKQGQKAIPREELLHYVRDAASALDYLHANRVLHRDIKPDNILLRGGQAKVADFGLFRDQKQLATLHRPVGTPAYMAPEVWACKAEAASDQYSLACTYVELRCGQRPFQQRTVDDLNEAHANDPPDLSLLNEVEQRVLSRALAKQPAERYASCGEMIHALETAASGIPPTAFDLPVNTLPRVEDESRTDVIGSLVAPGLRPGPASLAPTHVESNKKPGAPPIEPDGWRPGAKKRRSFGLVIGLACVIGIGGLAYFIRHHSGPDHSGRVEPIKKDQVYLPPDYEPAAKSVVDHDGTPYYSRIVRRIDNQEVVFHLIRPDKAGAAPFYLMENKVSNGLFRVFASKEPSAVAKSVWQLGAQAGEKDLGNGNDRLPVFRVTRIEAERFARWLGGRLPTAAQLDQAALREAPTGGRGVGRWKEGPLEVVDGEGVYQVTGNGREWTRDDLKAGEETVAVLRGRSYASQASPETKRFAPPDPELTPTQYPTYASPTTSFRVVIELPEG